MTHTVPFLTLLILLPAIGRAPALGLLGPRPAGCTGSSPTSLALIVSLVTLVHRRRRPSSP